MAALQSALSGRYANAPPARGSPIHKERINQPTRNFCPGFSKLLIIGDSNVKRVWLARRWVDAALHSLSGAKCGDILDRFSDLTCRAHGSACFKEVSCIWVIAGTNDINKGSPAEDARRGASALIAHLERNFRRVRILVIVPRIDRELNPQQAAVDRTFDELVREWPVAAQTSLVRLGRRDCDPHDSLHLRRRCIMGFAGRLCERAPPTLAVAILRDLLSVATAAPDRPVNAPNSLVPKRGVVQRGRSHVPRPSTPARDNGPGALAQRRLKRRRRRGGADRPSVMESRAPMRQIR